jgi:hypothetical protein
MDSAAGTYEAVLRDLSAAGADDGALYRGSVSLTVTRTGGISGKLNYSQPLAIAGTPQPALKAYRLKTASFSGSFAIDPSVPNKVSYTAAPGSANLPTGHALTVTVDMAQTPPALSVKVAQPAVAGVASSQGSSAELLQKTLTALPTELAALSKNYVLTAELPEKAYTLLQVLQTGRLTWTTKMPGYSGTGSASVSLNSAGAPSAVFFEGHSSSSADKLSSTALFSQLAFSSGNSGQVWNAHFQSADGLSFVEKQTTQIALSSGTPVYDAGAFATGEQQSGVSQLGYPSDAETRWDPTDPLNSFNLFNSQPLLLNVVDPIPDAAGNPVRYTWNVTLLPSGSVRISNIAPSTTTPPALSLKFDRATGQFTGNYRPSTDGAQRRTLNGVPSKDGWISAQPFRGWAEVGAAPTLSASWTLGLLMQ